MEKFYSHVELYKQAGKENEILWNKIWTQILADPQYYEE